MRASYYHGNRTFRTAPAPMPTPKAGEVLLRVRRVGICGTDLHIFQGHLDHRVPFRLAGSGAVPVGPLVSRRIPLEDLQKGMEEALAGGPVMKVLVDPVG
jgi:threonine dehydrogenase-like Zn-dependent dehydrogenase